MIEDFFGSATLFDVVVILVAMGLFVAGWLQGTIRSLLSTGSLLAAFVIAGGLRGPLGEFLATHWTYYDRTFNLMLALLGVWLAVVVTFQIGIEVFYRRVVIHRRLVVLDEVLGGFLGSFQVILLVALLAITFASYYDTVAPGTEPRDIGWARTLEDLLRDSAVASTLRDGFIPGLLAILGPLLPQGVVAPAP